MDGKNENIGNEDVVEVALPDYTEERSAIPDVEMEVSFAENKEENFLRNRELAAEMAKSGCGTEFENSGTVFSFGDAEINTADYLGNNFSRYVWGVFDSEMGAVEYALWSAEPIPDKYKRVLTDSEQEVLAKEGIIIGCYPSYCE